MERIELVPGTPIRGRVVDERSGKPIAGAHMFAWDPLSHDELDFDPDQEFPGLVTDTNGGFELLAVPSGRDFLLGVLTPGLGAHRALHPPVSPLVIKLGSGAVLSGVVTDADGEPVGGAHSPRCRAAACASDTARGDFGTLGPMSPMSQMSRRELLAAAAATGATAAVLGRKAWADPPAVPFAVSSANGLAAVARACQEVAAGVIPVVAAVEGVGLNEADPQDTSVGLGGSPNEDGVMELDSCCMDGTRGLGGAVASIRDILHPSQVALKVLERSDHVLLVGKGAYRFARAHGFPHTDLLTDDARKRWLHWKENLSDKDDWLPERQKGGTISCLVRAANGHLGGCTTTSGLSFKIPGRVGDSPIIGAGLYVDDTAGAAGATGRGEAVILTSGSFLATEAMRRGASAEEAALEACKRIVARTRDERLRDAEGRPRFDVKIYCLRKDGDHGAAAIWSGATYAVQDADGVRHRPAAFVFDRKTRRMPKADAKK